jgi:hypothetical protein
VTLPEGVHARLGGDVIIALVAEPRVSEEPAPAPVAAAAPEAKAGAKTEAKPEAKPEAKK